MRVYTIGDIIPQLLTHCRYRIAFSEYYKISKELLFAIARNRYSAFFKMHRSLFEDRPLSFLKDDFVWALSLIRDSTSRELFRGYLTDNDYKIKGRAIWGIANNQQRAYKEKLIRMYFEEPKLRIFIDDALQYMGFDYLPVRMLSLFTKREFKNLEKSIMKISSKQDLLTFALAISESKDAGIRQASTSILCDINSIEAHDRLVALMSDKDLAVQKAAHFNLYTWKKNNLDGFITKEFTSNKSGYNEPWYWAKSGRRNDVFRFTLPKVVIFLLCYQLELSANATEAPK